MRQLISELDAYFTLLIGIVADHVSTRMALTRDYVVEKNTVVVWLVSRELWLIFDCVTWLLSVAASIWIMRRWKYENRWLILLYFIVGGWIRISMATMNMLLWAFF